MAWVRLPDELATAPEVVEMPLDCLGLHVRALAYSNAHGLDLKLPRKALGVLGGTPARVSRLTRSGWWQDIGQVILLVLWGDLQPTAQEVAELRAKRASAGSRGGLAKASAGKPPSTCQLTATNTALAKPCPVPSRPDPVPDPRAADAALPHAPAREATAPADDRETPCPPDLEQRLVSLGVVSEMAKALGASEQDVLAVLQEFVGYWTIGAGAADRRAHWPKRAREHIRKRHLEGKLRGVAPLESGDPARAAAEAYVREQAKRRGETLPPDEFERRVLHELDPATHAARRAVARDRERIARQGEAEPDRATAAKQASAVEALIRGVG